MRVDDNRTIVLIPHSDKDARRLVSYLMSRKLKAGFLVRYSEGEYDIEVPSFSLDLERIRTRLKGIRFNIEA
jgi:hypothetical protein